jgi:hypothetical protein
MHAVKITMKSFVQSTHTNKKTTKVDASHLGYLPPILEHKQSEQHISSVKHKRLISYLKNLNK